MQLQKIANSRTGGEKTDEALGKTGGGPEGLPHSIIVTADGGEGEIALASQVEAGAGSGVSTGNSDLIGEKPAAGRASRKTLGKAKTKASGGTQPVTGAGKARKGRADQMALFAEGSPPSKASGHKGTRASKSAGSRGRT